MRCAGEQKQRGGAGSRDRVPSGRPVVAISPRFIMLQHGGANATVSDLAVGLAVAAVALFATSGTPGCMGLQLGSLALGAWLIIAPFILAPGRQHRHLDVLVQHLGGAAWSWPARWPPSEGGGVPH
jgi:hypothetical protein